jgi:hypothetical protein
MGKWIRWIECFWEDPWSTRKCVVVGMMIYAFFWWALLTGGK